MFGVVVAYSHALFDLEDCLIEGLTHLSGHQSRVLVCVLTQHVGDRRKQLLALGDQGLTLRLEPIPRGIQSRIDRRLVVFVVRLDDLLGCRVGRFRSRLLGVRRSHRDSHSGQQISQRLIEVLVLNYYSN